MFMDNQRKLVQSRGLNNKTGFKNLSDILHNTKSLLDFIYYSIDNTSKTDFLLKENAEHVKNFDLQTTENYLNLYLMNSKPLRNKPISEFGQTLYLIKFADNMYGL